MRSLEYRRPRTGTALVAVALMVVSLLALGARPSDAGSAEGAEVSVLHGIGPGPATVDLYLGETDATDWDLLLADVSYGDSASLGAVAAGGYNVLICNAVGAPAASIATCPSGAVNSNFGTNVTVPTSGNITLVAAYGGPDGEAAGRPVVLAFENDVSCVNAGEGRLGLRHAATAPAVDILLALPPGPAVVGDVVFGESVELDLEAGSYGVEIQLSSDGTTVLGPTTADVVEGESLLVYAVGNPQFDAPFALLTQVLELDTCPPETTTTTVTVPDPDPVPPTPPARPVPARPTFTG